MLVNDDILQPIFRIKIYSISYLNTIYNVGCIKSFVDDLIWTRYCKHESSLVLRSAEVLPLFIDLCNRFEISISYQLPFHPPTYHTPMVVYGNNQELASPPNKPRQGTSKFDSDHRRYDGPYRLWRSLCLCASQFPPGYLITWRHDTKPNNNQQPILLTLLISVTKLCFDV